MKTNPIDSDRLFNAADALLNAMNTQESLETLTIVLNDLQDSRGGPFTRAELVDALEMLIRLGFVIPEKT